MCIIKFWTTFRINVGLSDHPKKFGISAIYIYDSIFRWKAFINHDSLGQKHRELTQSCQTKSISK